MPGKNGMGPEGKGPMTGRRVGNCSSQGKEQQSVNTVGVTLRKGRGLGLRNGSGQGRGGQ